jgi:hypothetical protein
LFFPEKQGFQAKLARPQIHKSQECTPRNYSLPLHRANRLSAAESPKPLQDKEVEWKRKSFDNMDG